MAFWGLSRFSIEKLVYLYGAGQFQNRLFKGLYPARPNESLYLSNGDDSNRPIIFPKAWKCRSSTMSKFLSHHVSTTSASLLIHSFKWDNSKGSSSSMRLDNFILIDKHISHLSYEEKHLNAVEYIDCNGQPSHFSKGA
jgi:hypothetical protein